ncbi:MAG: NAD+ synthase [Spirochaetales bacterium]|nr:NAD+ synthase [Spirochaetales bacterium]
MKIALAQFNPKVGDFSGNSTQLLALAQNAAQQGVRLLVFPEMSLCGYPPLDLLSFPAFLRQSEKALNYVAQNLPSGLATVVGSVAGAPQGSEKTLMNVAFVLLNGQIVFQQAKRLLPTYDVFDERRYFAPGQNSVPFELDGLKLGIAICEDLWWEVSRDLGTPYAQNPVEDLVNAGVDLILSPSASPYHVGKAPLRHDILQSIAQNFRVPVAYVNQVGGNDSLIFDGNSLVTDAQGRLVAQGASFAPDLVVWETTAPVKPLPLRTVSPWGELRQALALGIRDYAQKSGFTHLHLGLSGGIDSAVVAVLAVDALGADNGTCFGMPSRYSSSGSIADAEALARNLGVSFQLIPIEGPFNAFLAALAPVFQGTTPGVAEENLQARIRGTYLMAYSNKFSSLLLTTGNKSELSVGYCTLYGDMAGGLGAIGDLLKTEVYALAREMNAERELIPTATLTKPPSAELRPDQTDQDSLPPYDDLDRLLQGYIVRHESVSDLVQHGEAIDLAERVLKLTASAEYKRWQAPPVLKVSPVSFGIGRRLPLVRSLFELDHRVAFRPGRA